MGHVILGIYLGGVLTVLIAMGVSNFPKEVIEEVKAESGIAGKIKCTIGWLAIAIVLSALSLLTLIVFIYGLNAARDEYIKNLEVMKKEMEDAVDEEKLNKKVLTLKKSLSIVRDKNKILYKQLIRAEKRLSELEGINTQVNEERMPMEE